MGKKKESTHNNEENISSYIKNTILDIGCELTENDKKDLKLIISPLQLVELSIKLESNFNIHFRDDLISENPAIDEIIASVKKSLKENS